MEYLGPVFVSGDDGLEGYELGVAGALVYIRSSVRGMKDGKCSAYIERTVCIVHAFGDDGPVVHEDTSDRRFILSEGILGLLH